MTVDPSNQFLYVGNDGAANISGYKLNAANGGLTANPAHPLLLEATRTSSRYYENKADSAHKTLDIPAEQMKMRRPHWVPLAPQCVAILKQQRQISGDGRYVFPNGRSGSNRPMSDGAMGAALKWLWFAHDGLVPHGFRVSASTLLHELGFDPKIIEAQLAHEKLDQVAKVYNRAVYLPERRALMER